MNMHSKWIDDLYSFYIALPLRRPVANAAPPKIASHLLKRVRLREMYRLTMLCLNIKNKPSRPCSWWICDSWPGVFCFPPSDVWIMCLGRQGWRPILHHWELKCQCESARQNTVEGGIVRSCKEGWRHEYVMMGILIIHLQIKNETKTLVSFLSGYQIQVPNRGKPRDYQIEDRIFNLASSESFSNCHFFLPSKLDSTFTKCSPTAVDPSCQQLHVMTSFHQRERGSHHLHFHQSLSWLLLLLEEEYWYNVLLLHLQGSTIDRNFPQKDNTLDMSRY